MTPEKSEASAKAGPGVLLGGEHLIRTVGGSERQSDSTLRPYEFEAQKQALGARLGLSAPVAGLVLYHLRGGRG